MGVNLVASFSSNSSYEQFATSRHVDLNLVMCHRSINYVAEMMDEAYGIPALKVNFIGANQSAKSLRKLADYYGDEELKSRTEAIIEEEMAAVEEVRAKIEERCRGKKVMLFVGGSRAHHYQHLFKEIGMEVLAAGYEFGHRDDYEGREVLPNIKIDADSRNIEELTIEKAEELYREWATPEIAARFEKGEGFEEYEGLMPEMADGTLAIDDPSQWDTDKLIEELKPDIVCCGIKEKYSIQKHGIPSRQLHSYDYGGPYAGFEGAINFYKDIDRMLHSKVWKAMNPPWAGAATEAAVVLPD
jgi:nitrogenase molybdenum-iron protein alpha chain